MLVLVFMVHDVLSSDTCIVVESTCWFIAGVVRLFRDRSSGQRLMPAGQGENAWGFGQIVELLLLWSIIFTIAEAISGMSLKDDVPDCRK